MFVVPQVKTALATENMRLASYHPLVGQVFKRALAELAFHGKSNPLYLLLIAL